VKTQRFGKVRNIGFAATSTGTVTQIPIVEPGVLVGIQWGADFDGSADGQRWQLLAGFSEQLQSVSAFPADELPGVFSILRGLTDAAASIYTSGSINFYHPLPLIQVNKGFIYVQARPSGGTLQGFACLHFRFS
jgi:hypothetical protein